MSEFWQIIAYTTMAGAMIPLGGAIARIERIQPNWLDEELRHGVIAFGGGVLLAAVALVLVPDGMEEVSLTGAAVAMLGGGVAFLVLDETMQRLKGPASQLTAMLADFLPEAIALGAAFAGPGKAGLLLAILISLQNLPEGFNAYREMTVSAGMKRSTVLLIFIAVVPLGPIAGLLGYALLSPYPTAIGSIMLFASGGILYLMFQDIGPQARLEQRWGPPLGAVLGFLAGLIGQQLVH